MKKHLPFLFIFTAVLTCLPMTASANSAQMYFHGTAASGVVVNCIECPVGVEKENLTFNIKELPKTYYGEGEEYPNTVTAEYHLKNANDFTANLRLAFPFDTSAHIASNGENSSLGVFLDGQPVPYTLRRTFKRGTFITEQDVSKLRDDLLETPYFTQNTPVYIYYIDISGVKSEERRAAVSFDIYKDDGVQILSSNWGKYSPTENGILNVGLWAEVPSDTVCIASIGGEIKDIQSRLTLYEDLSYKRKLSGSVTVNEAKCEQTTYKNFILSYYELGKQLIPNISETDFYNAATEKLSSSDTFPYLGSLNEVYRMETLCWYQYDISIAPNSTAVHTVTAPIFPTIDLQGYSAAYYTYEYLLSPASGWKYFKDLNINIITDSYMVGGDRSPASLTFEKTDDGYSAQADRLPEGELTFNLCKIEDPTPNLARKWTFCGGCR